MKAARGHEEPKVEHAGNVSLNRKIDIGRLPIAPLVRGAPAVVKEPRLIAATATGLSGTNVASGKTATQSSVAYSAPASRAVDGNTNGVFSNNSVTHTNLEANAWWQVDLGSSYNVSSVQIWNRTDCCSSRLDDYWVFISDTPFLSTDTPATLQNRANTWSSRQLTAPPASSPSATIASGAQGRYVRVQLNGTNNLSLAEVKVFSASTVGSPTWGNSYTMDGFGNLTTKAVTAGSAPALSVAVDAANRIVGVSYDANGNQLPAGVSGPYDIENRLLSWDGATLYGYGPDNKRVMKRWGTAHNWHEQYTVYGQNGKELGVYDLNWDVNHAPVRMWFTETKTRVYFGSREISSWTDPAVLVDRLGSKVSQGTAYPYGEVRTGEAEYTGYHRDAESGLHYADQRYYSSQYARFLTGDPYKANSGGAGDPEDPGSWNRYAYVTSDPINYYDPAGLIKACPSGNGCKLAEESPPERPGHGSRPANPNTPKPSRTTIGGQDPVSPECQAALDVTQKDVSAVDRALKAKSILESAVQGTNIDWRMLAAIGVRESGFESKTEKDGAGVGVGIFQLTVNATSGVTAAQAKDLTFAANYAAKELNNDMKALAASFPALTSAQLMQATAAAYNFGTGNISGNPATIDVGSAGGNYGSNVIALINCF